MRLDSSRKCPRQEDGKGDLIAPDPIWKQGYWLRLAQAMPSRDESVAFVYFCKKNYKHISICCLHKGKEKPSDNDEIHY